MPVFNVKGFEDCTAVNIDLVYLIGCDLGRDTHIGAFVSIGAGACVGRECQIKAGTVIEPGAFIGDSCVIGPNAVIPQGMVIPDGSIVDAPCRIQAKFNNQPTMSCITTGEEVDRD